MLSFIFVFLGLFVDIEITINCTQYAYSSPCSIPSSLILTVLCFFCLFSLLIYGFRIYFEMKRIEVSRNIIVKVCFRFPLDSFQMIIILFISSFTFFFRAIIEILFLFDVIELDFEFSFRFFRLPRSTSSNGSMHLIGSHLYASYLSLLSFITSIARCTSSSSTSLRKSRLSPSCFSPPTFAPTRARASLGRTSASSAFRATAAFR